MLQADNLVITRGERVLAQELSLRLEPGQVLYVRGRNGSGKTTLLRTLAGLTLPEVGEVAWRGRDIRRDNGVFRSELLFLGHQAGLKAQLSPLENLESLRRLRPNRAAQAGQALAALGLTEVAHLPCAVLSAGQRRRVALARLLCEEARLWILDEPFTALDTAAVEQLSRNIDAHLAVGGLAILTSHQPLDLAGECRTLELPHV